MTTLNDVPADTQMVMTEDLERLFRVAKCNPPCHACLKTIPIGGPFQLVSLDGTDEMTCGKCGRDDLRERHKQVSKEKAQVVTDRAQAKEKHRLLKRSQEQSGYSRSTRT